jgi:N-acetyl-gamma-glutamyl-phosphate reductase
MHKNAVTKVAVVGARGYSGAELCRLLLRHPAVSLEACLSADAGFSLQAQLPELQGPGAVVVPTRQLTDLAAVAAECDAIFLATPAEASMKLAPEALAAGAHVIDLSGAFRLEAAEFAKWYGHEHSSPELIARAHYGLVPWCGPLDAPSIKKCGTTLVANPGCYATAALLALIPLLRDGLVDPATLVIDAKSGTTGAGRKATENLLFSEVDGECLPYKVGRHQHLPELRKYVAAFAQAEIDPHFATHLLPVRRGIICGLYARTRASAAEIAASFERAYAGYPLVRAREGEPGPLRRVVGSARAEISFTVTGDKLYVFSMIDNLLKGAASQAVENLNRLLDLPPETALTQLEGTL